MPSSSRIVFAEDLPETAPWRPGEIAGAALRPNGRRAVEPAPGTARAAPTYEDGLREGHARGLEAARRETREARRREAEAIAARADALLGAFTAQLAEVQHTHAEEVVELAVEIARSAFGAALRVRDDAVAPAVVAALVGEQLAPLLAARGAQLLVDETIAVGGCRVDTARASVDATVATRWRRALAAIGRDDAWVEA